MALYYRLTTDNVPKEQEEKIGDMMDALCAELEKKSGAKLALFNGPVDEALDEYFKNHDSKSLNE